jgi:hypothetical protein
METCDKEFLFEDGKRCVRKQAVGHQHLGLHRDTARVRPFTVQWGDNESKTEVK